MVRRGVPRLSDDAGMTFHQEAPLNIIGIDLGKTVFHLVTMDEDGKIVGRKKLSRPPLLKHMATAPCSLIAMEASCGAHYLGRAFRGQVGDELLQPVIFIAQGAQLFGFVTSMPPYCTFQA